MADDLCDQCHRSGVEISRTHVGQTICVECDGDHLPCSMKCAHPNCEKICSMDARHSNLFAHVCADHAEPLPKTPKEFEDWGPDKFKCHRCGGMFIPEETVMVHTFRCCIGCADTVMDNFGGPLDEG